MVELWNYVVNRNELDLLMTELEESRTINTNISATSDGGALDIKSCHVKVIGL